MGWSIQSPNRILIKDMWNGMSKIIAIKIKDQDPPHLTTCFWVAFCSLCFYYGKAAPLCGLPNTPKCGPSVRFKAERHIVDNGVERWWIAARCNRREVLRSLRQNLHIQQCLCLFAARGFDALSRKTTNWRYFGDQKLCERLLESISPQIASHEGSQFAHVFSTIFFNEHVPVSSTIRWRK